MTKSLRMTGLAAGFGLLLLLMGCGGMKIEDFEGQEPTFVLEEYFAGPTKAWGWFEDRFGRVQRQFVVDMTGTVEGDVLTLDEHFVYDDGERERRVWTLKILPDGHYEGTADGVLGTASGRVVGPALHWSYEFALKVGERTWNVHFDDWMIRQDDDVVINRATVSKWGFTLGTVILFFKKPEGWQASAVDAAAS
ncbi:MAG: DUF3833 domain-containing protein [Pseudomonadota bacterium]